MNYELRNIENALVKLEELEDELQDNQKRLDKETIEKQQTLIKDSIQVIEGVKKELERLENVLH